MPCVPQVPFPMPEYPLSDEEADALGLTALLNTSQPGTCHCGEEYVAPECPPPCEDCDDVVDGKSFAISGLSSPNDIYNGTYSLTKGAFDCEFIACCWFGDNGTYNALLQWTGGLWSLQIDGGIAYYELTADACTSPLVMTKVEDNSTGAVFPGTVTVS
jgi:hypothetical protein